MGGAATGASRRPVEAGLRLVAELRRAPPAPRRRRLVDADAGAVADVRVLLSRLLDRHPAPVGRPRRVDGVVGLARQAEQPPTRTAVPADEVHRVSAAQEQHLGAGRREVGVLDPVVSRRRPDPSGRTAKILLPSSDRRMKAIREPSGDQLGSPVVLRVRRGRPRPDPTGCEVDHRQAELRLEHHLPGCRATTTTAPPAARAWSAACARRRCCGVQDRQVAPEVGSGAGRDERHRLAVRRGGRPVTVDDRPGDPADRVAGDDRPAAAVEQQRAGGCARESGRGGGDGAEQPQGVGEDGAAERRAAQELQVWG